MKRQAGSLPATSNAETEEKGYGGSCARGRDGRGRAEDGWIDGGLSTVGRKKKSRERGRAEGQQRKVIDRTTAMLCWDFGRDGTVRERDGEKKREGSSEDDHDTMARREWEREIEHERELRRLRLHLVHHYRRSLLTKGRGGDILQGEAGSWLAVRSDGEDTDGEKAGVRMLEWSSFAAHKDLTGKIDFDLPRVGGRVDAERWIGAVLAGMGICSLGAKAVAATGLWPTQVIGIDAAM